MGYLERDIQVLARKLSVFKTSKESKAEKQVRVCVCVWTLYRAEGERGNEREIKTDREEENVCVLVR
jgi:hypothetical protein